MPPRIPAVIISALSSKRSSGSDKLEMRALNNTMWAVTKANPEPSGSPKPSTSSPNRRCSFLSACVCCAGSKKLRVRSGRSEEIAYYLFCKPRRYAWGHRNKHSTDASIANATHRMIFSTPKKRYEYREIELLTVTFSID